MGTLQSKLAGLIRLLKAHPGQVYHFASQHVSVTVLRVLRILLIIRETFWEFSRNSGITRASGLAYASLLALVPLVAAFSTIFAAFFRNYADQIDVLLNRAFPYESAQITVYIHEFTEKARALTGFGLVAFLVIALFLFVEVDETINRLWHVPKRRPFRAKLYSFTMLLFWGPVMLGLYSTAAFYVKRNVFMHELATQTYVFQPVPFLVTFLALTMLYWLVPNTPVRLRNAALAGIAAAGLFQVLRFGLAAYFGNSPLNFIYGAITLVLVVLISLDFIWIVILFGVSLAYTSQNFKGILREHQEARQGAPAHHLYYGIRALAEIAGHYVREQRPPTVERLARRMVTTEPLIQGLLLKLKDAGFVDELVGEPKRYTLLRAPDRILLANVAQVLEADVLSLPAEPADSLHHSVSRLLKDLERGAEITLENATLADLVGGASAAIEDSGEFPVS